MFSRGRPNEDLKPFGIAPTFSGGNYMEFLLNIFTEVHFFNFFLELGCPGNPLQKSGKQVRRDQESSSGVLGGVHFFNFFLELGCPGNPLQKIREAS